VLNESFNGKSNYTNGLEFESDFSCPLTTMGVGFNIAEKESLKAVLLQGIDTQDKHSLRLAA